MLKKMMPWLIMVLVSITLILGTAVVLYKTVFKESEATTGNAHADARQSVEGVGPIEEEPPAKELPELTYEIKDVTTNLGTGDTIRISFTFQFNKPEVKKEFELKKFKIDDVIIHTLRDTKVENLQGSQGLDALTSGMMNKVNQLLKEGKVTRIYVTNMILV